jgi:NADH-quinone oxidoreductase subunit N
MPAGYSPSDFAALTPEFVLTGVALLVLLLDAFVPKARHGVIAWISLAGLAVTAVTLVPYAGAHTTAVRGMIAVDGFATFFQILFLFAAGLTILMSPRYLQVEGARPGTYYFLVLSATLGMMFMASALDLVTIFIGLETMAISFYILVGFLKPNRRSNEAAVKYFLLGAFSLGLLLYGMSILYGLTATTNLRTIATLLAGESHHPWLPLGVILVVAGIGFKIAAVPFHMWVPDVYEGAPTPITAFLSVGSKAASFAMLLRIFFEGLPAVNDQWGVLFYALAILTMTTGNIAALTQSNIKRMLAYSSIAHAGYLLIAVVAATRVPQVGITAALVYLVVYAFMQFGAFAIVTLLRRQDVIGEELKDLSGLFQRSPLAGIAMLLFMLSLGGIPPTAGFMG